MSNNCTRFELKTEVTIRFDLKFRIFAKHYIRCHHLRLYCFLQHGTFYHWTAEYSDLALSWMPCSLSGC